MLPAKHYMHFIRQRKASVEDVWSVAIAEDNGKPLIIRVRHNILARVDPTKYPNLLAITWQYEPISESGMPSKQDEERMSLLEDLLDQALESNGLAYLTVVVTGNGVREWQWYSGDTQQTMTAINTSLSGHKRFPVELVSEADANWEAYRKFVH
jgi:hypothetical protein